MEQSISTSDKISINSDCAKGFHSFIVSAWRINPHSQTATSFACKHCLYKADKVDAEIQTKSIEETIFTKKLKAKSDSKPKSQAKAQN